MKAMGSLKKVVVSLVVFALLLTNTVIVRAEINPEHAIIGNNDPEPAYNIGNWKYKSIKTCAIEENQTESAWHTSKVSSATSGSYHISSSDRIPVKQRWSFKYNAKAGAKSSMNSVKLRVDYIYDITSDWNFR